MQISNQPQINSKHFENCRKAQGHSAPLEKSNVYSSAPTVSPLYFTPNFTSLDKEYKKERILITKEEIDGIKEELKDLSQEETFDKLKITYRKDDEGKYIISDFTSPFCYEYKENVSMSQLGIDFDKMLHNVVEIEGCADFVYAELSPFETLKKVHGQVSATLAKIDSLGSLEEVDDRLILDGAKIKNLGQLKKCDQIILSTSSGITSLAPLEEADSVSVHHSDITDVSSLKKCRFFNGVDCDIPEEQKEDIRSIVTDAAVFTEAEYRTYIDKIFNNI